MTFDVTSITRELNEVRSFIDGYYDLKEELLGSIKTLELNKRLAATAVPLVKAELAELDAELAKKEERRYELFMQVAKYVFNSDSKTGDLIIEAHRDCASYRNDDGGYDEILYYTFKGPLGKLLELASDFSDTGEVYFGYQDCKISVKDEKARKLTSTMTYESFIGVFLNYFCDCPDRFKKYK